uniref:U1 small nuclear ribonucleoprotein 70 kDa n=1 Tax=Meloidogyne javanica TaxID=6303 RepID=A0A915LF35_MELJA
MLNFSFLLLFKTYKMTQFLPDNLLGLFAPRAPIQYKPPPDDLFINRKHIPIDGIAEHVQKFEDPKDTPPKVRIETRDEKRTRKRKERQELMAYKIEQGIATWTPADNPRATSDPYKTLFIARIVVLVHDKTGKPRGYAFIEYEHKSDMSAAYKKADGTKIDGRRVVVDYERGRTKKSWLPRRLGGGKGETRRTRESKAALAAKEWEESMANGSEYSRGGSREHRRSRDRRSRSKERDRR